MRQHLYAYCIFKSMNSKCDTRAWKNNEYVILVRSHTPVAVSTLCNSSSYMHNKPKPRQNFCIDKLTVVSIDTSIAILMLLLGFYNVLSVHKKRPVKTRKPNLLVRFLSSVFYIYFKIYIRIWFTSKIMILILNLKMQFGRSVNMRLCSYNSIALS